MTEQPDSSSADDAGAHDASAEDAESDDASAAAEENADGSGSDEAAADVDERGPAGRDVVVPLRLYKTITVFSTLIAIVSILGGFVLLDRATQRATASPDEVSLPLAALALALIVAGSAVYALSTRFRTEGMGKSKDDTDRPSDNG